jgi:16S rRNA processing protein RimM
LKSSNKISAPAETILIGKIIAAHGIRGAVRILSYAESLDLFATGTSLWVKPAGAATVAHTVAWVQSHGPKVRMAFNEVSDRNAAEALIGADLLIERARLPDLEADTYYWFELIGLAVEDTAGKRLGEIDAVLPTGSNDVYVVKDKSRHPAGELLIPALATVVLEVDLAKGVMRVELPDGLEGEA